MSEILSAAAVLWRRRSGPEVFLARRVPRMRFFGAVHAFCGGRVDEVDRRLGAGPGCLRSTVVRELVEELGIDARRGGVAVEEEARRRLCDGAVAWDELCTADSLAALPDPCLRLVTPEFYPRRFDTWFFVIEVDPDCEPRLQRSELDDGGWDRPAGWLARWTAGEFQLAPPAVLMLRVLARHRPEEWERALREEQQAIEDPAALQEIRIEPAIRLLPLRTPTLPPARHTNCYLVGDRRAWLVDPATPYPDERERLARTLERVGLDRLAGVLLTHHHEDHVGASDFVRERCGLPVLAHAETAARLAGRVAVDRELQDGERIAFVHADGEAGALESVFSPGHAPGHLCFHEPRYGGLIAGDMVSTLSSILIDPEDGDMGDYLASLRRLAAIEPSTVYPAHGPPDSRGARVLAEQLAHREERAAAVLEATQGGPVALDDLVAQVWGDVPRPMLGLARKSAISVLRHLAARGRLSFDGRSAACR